MVQIRFCPKCGTEVVPGAVFCVSCGAGIPTVALPPPVSLEQAIPTVAQEAVQADAGKPAMAQNSLESPSDSTPAQAEVIPDHQAIVGSLPKAVVVVLIVVCVLLLIVRLFAWPSTYTLFALCLGESIPYTLLVWLIFRFTVQAGRPPTKGRIVFIALYSVMSIGGWIGADIRVHEQKREAQQVTPSFEKALEGVKAMNEGRPDPKAMDQIPISNSSTALSEQWMKDGLKKQAELTAAYFKEVEELGLLKAFDMTGIEVPGEVDIRIEQARKMRMASEVYKTNYLALQDSTRASVMTLNVSEELRRGIIAGMDENNNRAAKVRVLDGTIRQMDLIRQRFQLLKRVSGHWVMDGKMIRFERGQDLAAFNSMTKEIQKIAAEQEAESARATTAMEKWLKDFKTMNN